MDEEEIKEMIRENRELAEQNNELLHKIHRWVVWRRFTTILYWVIVIGIAVGAFYFLQPVVEPFLDAYDQVRAGLTPTDQVENIQGATTSDRLQ